MQGRLQSLSVARACRHFGISRQAYYKAGHRQQQLVEGARAIALVGGYRARQPRTGTRKLHGLIMPALQAPGIAMGRAACMVSFVIPASSCLCGVRITRQPTGISVSSVTPTCSRLANGTGSEEVWLLISPICRRRESMSS